jgi:hypothetical protein
MSGSRQQLPRRGKGRTLSMVAGVIVALVGVSVIVVVAWPGGRGLRADSQAVAGSSSAGPQATAAQPSAPATQAAAEEAKLGGAVTPRNSLRVAVWNTGHGGAAMRAVTARLGTVQMMYGAKHISAMRQACQTLSGAVTTALAATPIPDSMMQLWYKRALTNIGTGAADCRAGISSKLSGDEDLEIHQNAAVMSRAMSEFSTGNRELYKATAYLKTLKRS